MVDRDDFDEWRAKYDTLSLKAQMRFYNEIEYEYPEQRHFRLDHAIQFFKEVFVCENGNNVNICEAGGWKGDLAHFIFQIFPDINIWVNIEICTEAIRKTRCMSDKYKAVLPDTFRWWENKCMHDYNVFIATHFIEHISRNDFSKLMDTMAEVKHIYLEAPLKKSLEETWDRYNGTHINTITWFQIDKLIESTHKLIWRKDDCSYYKFSDKEGEQ